MSTSGSANFSRRYSVQDFNMFSSMQLGWGFQNITGRMRCALGPGPNSKLPEGIWIGCYEKTPTSTKS